MIVAGLKAETLDEKALDRISGAFLFVIKEG